jgi:hypothetical protein
VQLPDFSLHCYHLAVLVLDGQLGSLGYQTNALEAARHKVRIKSLARKISAS